MNVDVERQPNVTLAVLGLLVAGVALPIGYGEIDNCAARDAAQALTLFGVPSVVGVAFGWTAWQLSAKPTAPRTLLALSVAVATGVAALAVVVLHWIDNCST